MSAAWALSTAAFLVYFIRLTHFESLPNEAHAAVLNGFLTVLTPLAVLYGAIVFNASLEHSGSLNTLSRFVADQTDGNPLAQALLVGWAFSFLIEGISGFGTPAAIAAPLLVSLGMNAFNAAVLTLAWNSVPVIFGAVGTPLWFGMSETVPEMSDDDLLIIGQRAAIMNTVAAFFIVPITLVLVFKCQKATFVKNAPLLVVGVFVTVLPFLLVSFISFEFPSIIGGLAGTLLIGVLAKHGRCLGAQRLGADAFRRFVEVDMIGVEIEGGGAGGFVRDGDEPHLEPTVSNVSPSSMTRHRSRSRRPLLSAVPVSGGRQAHRVSSSRRGRLGSHSHRARRKQSREERVKRESESDGEREATVGERKSESRSESDSMSVESEEQMSKAVDKEVSEKESEKVSEEGLRMDALQSDVHHGDGESQEERKNSLSLFALAKAFLPFFLLLFLLLLTRIEQIGLKGWLTSATPSFSLPLGTLGVFHMSPSLVVRLTQIFHTSSSWQHAILFVPSFLPFGLIMLITMLMYRKRKLKDFSSVFKVANKRLARALVPLTAALVMVKLLTMDGDRSSVRVIGVALGGLLGSVWYPFAFLLGALGAFFSGSNTVSNLTFAGVQQTIALENDLDVHTILALQASGGAFGNMICLHNIVSVAAILGLLRIESLVLRRTILPLFSVGVVVTIVSFFF